MALFVAGIEAMERRERIELMCLLEALSGGAAIVEAALKGAKTAKDTGLDLAARGTKGALGGIGTAARYAGAMKKLKGGRLARALERGGGALKAGGEHASEALLLTKERLEWKTDRLNEKAEQIRQEMERLSDAELSERLCRLLKRLAGTKNEEDVDYYARRINGRAAKSLKIDADRYSNQEALEEAVFLKIAEEMCERLKNAEKRLSEDERERWADELIGELQKLGRAEREAIRRALNLEEITGESALRALKTTSAAALAQGIVGGFGFGSYLFLTTAIKAIGLLFGATFSFSTYMAATSGLAFALSGGFLALVIGAAGAGATISARKRLNLECAKIAIAAGRGKFLSGASAARV